MKMFMLNTKTAKFRVSEKENGFAVVNPFGEIECVKSDRTKAEAICEAANRAMANPTPCSHGGDI